jgi:uncharacterized protein involved in exopolysaccharide biosynthesis
METTRSLRDTIELLLRHRVLVAAISCCAVVLATMVALFQTQIYQSTAVLLIKFGREMISRPEIGERETLVNRENAIINVEIQILRSEAVVEGAIEALTVKELYPGLYENPPEGVPIDRVAASRFRRNFIVSAVPASDVLKVSFRHTDPEVAAKTVNVLVDQFKKKHLETFGRGEATVFLDEQVESYRAALEQKEGQVQEFRSLHTAFSVKDPGALLMSQQSSLTGDLDRAREQIAAIRRRLATPAPVDTTERRSDRAELRSRLDEQTRLTTNLEAVEAELGNLAVLQKEYRQLVRERDETEELYHTYFKKLADARISNEMDRKRIANISVIQDGRVPLKPIRPKKVLYVAVGASAGLVLGCLAAFLVESLRIAPATASARPSPLRLRRS